MNVYRYYFRMYSLGLFFFRNEKLQTGRFLFIFHYLILLDVQTVDKAISHSASTFFLNNLFSSLRLKYFNEGLSNELPSFIILLFNLLLTLERGEGILTVGAV